MDILGYGLGLQCLLNGSSLGLKWKSIASPLNSYFVMVSHRKIVYPPFPLFIYRSYREKNSAEGNAYSQDYRAALGQPRSGVVV